MQVWSFFSGAMGLDLGLERAGLKPSLCVEIDQWCARTIQANRPDVLLLKESVHGLSANRLRQVTGFQGEVDLMVGGPPCQSFSPGGNRAALTDPRGNLIYEYLRLINEVQPHCFVLENVANLATAALKHRPISERPGKHWSLKKYDALNAPVDPNVRPLDSDEKSGSAIRQLLADIKSLGYSVSFSILDAADYGAPQKRLRFVMLGTRDALPIALPAPTHGHFGKLPIQTVRSAIYDLRDEPGPHSQYGPEMRKFFDLIPEGKNWRALPKHLQKEALGGSYEAGGGKTGFFRRLSWDAPAPTITTKSNRKGTSVCHPERTRPISVRESARLQGFPDDWSFTGAMNQQYQQIGNAVPVDLGTAIGNAITKNVKAANYNLEHMLDVALKRLRASAVNTRSARQPVADLFDLVHR